MDSQVIASLEKFLKSNLGEPLPKIRYFDGPECFSDLYGKYKADTLEESLEKFCQENLK